MIMLKPTINGIEVGSAKTDTRNAEDSEVARIIFFQNVDPRRRPELLDAELIREDHTKTSNLPQEFIHAAGRFDREYY
jgi:hypothetical protein